MHRRGRSLLLLICAFVSSVLTAQDAPAPQPFALAHVTVIDVRDGALHRDQTVIVRGNRISALGKAGALQVPKGTRVIDTSDKYLIPGLWDMHVHAMYEGRPEIFFPMFVANGVTGVREMASTFSLERISQIRDQITRGDVLGPRFAAVAGKIFEGPVPPDTLGPEFMSISTPEQARETVRSCKRQGADFIKVYHHLSREVYLAIADEAKRQGMPFAGHVPEALDCREASRAGQRSIEHLIGAPFDCFASNASELRTALAQESVPPALIDKRVAAYESADCASLFALFAKNETWHVPTLVLGRARLRAGDATLLEDERRKYIPPARREQWQAEMARRRAGMPEQVATSIWRHALKLVGAMNRGNVPMLAGSDTGLGNAYTFAGFSLHDELKLLAESGFSPLTALQAATLNPARFLKLTDTLGTVEPGKVADLVLLDANPLEDIRHTQKIAAVVLDGRYLDRRALDGLLAEAERAANPAAR
jgi:imidazolonepropionase-like amidohydrolase